MLEELEELDALNFENKNEVQTNAIIEKMKNAQKEDRASNIDRLEDIDIELLEENPFQYRLSTEEDRLDMVRSIKNHGIIQPLVVSKTKGKKYIVVVGHRRLDACKTIGMKKVRCIVKEQMTPKELRLKVFTENEQRLDPSRIETAMSIKQAIDSGDIKNANEYAKLVGKDRAYINKLLKLLTLPDKILNDLRIHKSTSDIVALDAIRRMADKEKSIEFYFWFIKEGSRKELLQKIENLKDKTDEEIIKCRRTNKQTDITIRKKITEEQIEKINSFIEKLILKD